KPGTYLLEDVALAVVPVPRLLPGPAAKGEASLLAVGDVDFGVGKAWPPLPATRREMADVRDRFSRAFDKAPAVALSGNKATRDGVRAALPSARFAHLATHGLFAPETVRSALAITAERDGLFGREGVSGWHPALLSGLVFAGANKEGQGVLTALEV